MAGLRRVARGAGSGRRPLPGGFGHVTDIDVVSPNDAWAISDYGYEVFNESHVYRWTGLRWSEVRFPRPHTGDVESWVLSAVEAVSPTEVWVVGSRPSTTGPRDLSPGDGTAAGGGLSRSGYLASAANSQA